MIKDDAARVAEVWSEARRLYEGGATAYGIARQTGLARSTVSARIVREGWVRGEGSATNAPRAATVAAGKAVKARAPVTDKPVRSMRKALVRRLYNAIDLKLRHWEDRMAAGGRLSPADSERMAKEISTMISGFERVAEAEGAIEKRDAQSAAAGTGNTAKPGRRGNSERGAGRTSDGDEADAVRMRREIAARLERLQVGGGEAGGAR